MSAKLVIVAGVGACAAACATIPEETKVLLDLPVDCAFAERDVLALEAAVPSGRDRVRTGVRSVVPVGVVTGVATGDYGDRVDVATGAHERALREKIAEIETACAPTDVDETGETGGGEPAAGAR